MSDAREVAEVAGRLTKMEADLICGRCNGWGSWMWSAGQRLAAMGLASVNTGSIQFDTPLGLAVRAYLQKEQADG